MNQCKFLTIPNFHLSKNQFKKLLKKKISYASLSYLNSIAESHSKSQPLVKKEFKCSEYIRDKRFSVSNVKLLLQLRTRTFPSKSNFRNQFKDDMYCNLCKIEICDQEHQMNCLVMRRFVPELNHTNVKYSDLFGSVDKQFEAVKLYSKIVRQKEILEEIIVTATSRQRDQ